MTEPLADLTTNHLTVTGDTLKTDFYEVQETFQAVLAVPTATDKHFLSA